MKSFATALLTASATAFYSSRDVYHMAYLAKYNKVYDTVEEFNMRKEIFLANDEKIEAINSDEKQTFKAAHNKFSDWTKEEFESILGLKNTMSDYVQEDIDSWFESDKINTDLTLPESWNWTELGKTSPVKD